jgi:DNA-binding IclR family transcriptional regulator
VTPRPSELAGVEPRPTRRRSPTAQLVSPSYDCVLCLAQHANGGVVRTITDPGVLEEQASATRARGYASEDGEYRDGVRAVAAP